MTDVRTPQLYVARTYWERFHLRLPWALAFFAVTGLIAGLTSGRTGTAVVTYTLSSIVSQAFLGAPMLTLVLALPRSWRPADGKDA